MSAKRYTEEFKREAVKQVTERNYPVSEVRVYHRTAGCPSDSDMITDVESADAGAVRILQSLC